MKSFPKKEKKILSHCPGLATERGHESSTFQKPSQSLLPPFPVAQRQAKAPHLFTGPWAPGSVGEAAGETEAQSEKKEGSDQTAS